MKWFAKVKENVGNSLESDSLFWECLILIDKILKKIKNDFFCLKL